MAKAFDVEMVVKLRLFADSTAEASSLAERTIKEDISPNHATVHWIRVIICEEVPRRS